VSSSKKKIDPDAGERGVQRHKRSKDKLIRLDNVFQGEKIIGGGQLFGATDNQKD
jgi:hypothetical protein